MMNHFKHCLFALLFSLCSFQIAAVEQGETSEDVKVRYPFESNEKETLFIQLTKELRCPKCQNQNIADSNAGVAMDLKNKTYQLVQEGKSKQDVIDYMVQRYGNFVTYQPPVNAVTIWLWLIPGLAALFLIGFVIKGRSKKVEKANSVSAASLAAADKLLQDSDKS